MTDRELLELAAKAAGMKPPMAWDDGWWNPLTDDGDALRLAVKLGTDISFNYGAQCVYAAESMEPLTRTPDPYAATRRAITRAAAEIGKEMP